MPASTATSPWTPPAADSSLPPAAEASPAPRPRPAAAFGRSSHAVAPAASPAGPSQAAPWEDTAPFTSPSQAGAWEDTAPFAAPSQAGAWEDTAPFAAPSHAAAWDAAAASSAAADHTFSDQPARAAASSSPRRLASLAMAAAVSLGAFILGAATALVTLALVLAATGHSGVFVGARSAPAVLTGAGFACAYTAAVIVLWRPVKLHPAALVALWALGLGAVVSGAGVAGALVAVAGGALAICLGAVDAPTRPDPRVITCLIAAGCVLSMAAGAIAPATHTRRPAPPAAVPAGPDPLGLAAPAPSPAPTATAVPQTPPTAPDSPHGNASATGPSSAATESSSAATESSSAATESSSVATGPSSVATGPSSPARPEPASPAATPTSPSHAAEPPAATATPAGPTTTTGPTGAATAPAVPPDPTDVAAATQLVRDFYGALDGHRFAAAWAVLSPSVQARFGGFDAWRAGYRTTLSSRPESIRVSPASGGGLLVRLTLVATDRTACGPRTARFAVTWQLVRSRASWGGASLRGVPLDGGSGTRACG